MIAIKIVLRHLEISPGPIGRCSERHGRQTLRKRELTCRSTPHSRPPGCRFTCAKVDPGYSPTKEREYANVGVFGPSLQSGPSSVWFGYGSCMGRFARFRFSVPAVPLSLWKGSFLSQYCFSRNGRFQFRFRFPKNGCDGSGSSFVFLKNGSDGSGFWFRFGSWAILSLFVRRGKRTPNHFLWPEPKP